MAAEHEPRRRSKVVGKRLPRVDARERVTGEARLSRRPRAAGHGAREDCCAARTRTPASGASTRRARQALQGVLAVVTAADFPELPVGATIPMGETGYDMWMVAQINMARRKVHWVGQPVAAVAAVDAHVAEAALALIEVDYEPLPAVLDIAAAMAADAPVLHEHVFTKGVEPRPRTPSNVCSRTVIARGDARAALGCRAGDGARRASQVDTAHQGYLEPQVVVARGRCQRLRHRVGLHAGPVHRRADDRAACSGCRSRSSRSCRWRSAAASAARSPSTARRWRCAWRRSAGRPVKLRALARGGAAGRLAAPPPAR